VARMSPGLITDGAFLPDGRMLLRGYGQVFVVQPPAEVKNDRLKTLASAMLPIQDQGESIAVIDGGKRALIGSEGRREPLLRITVPTVPGDKAGAATRTSAGQPPNSAPAADSGGSITAGSSSDHAFSDVDSHRLWVGVGGAAIVLIALIAGAGLLRNRRRY
jgi:hypothetical protein